MSKPKSLNQHLSNVRPRMTKVRARAMAKHSNISRRVERIEKIVWPEQRDVALAEAATIMSYSELAIRRMIQRGELRSSCMDYGNVRIAVSELKRWHRVQLDAMLELKPAKVKDVLSRLTRRLGL